MGSKFPKDQYFFRLVEVLTIGSVFYWQAFVMLRGKGEEVHNKRAVLLRKSFEKLSSVYIKFGQLLSLRSDFLSPAYCNELLYLLENVPAFPYEEVQRVWKEDFGFPLEKMFKKIEKKPIASASFGQVYVAYLKTGEKVAVKVQRPLILQRVKHDIFFMKQIAKIIDVLSRGPNKLLPIVKEFEEWTYKEIDYLNEATYTEKYYQVTQGGLNGITTPRIYREYCSSRVLTTEFIEGISLSKIFFAYKRQDKKILRKLKEKGFSRKLFAKRLLKESIKEMFLEDFFHADPHPANILFLSKS